MALAPGTRLGVYEIVTPIGEGGMGQVFRARDTKLDRDVAIKILPEAFAHDADRLARFTREAKTLASLNHPNIAAIYGLEESDGATALIMELVDGEDLSQRIAQGPTPIDETLPIAKQITEALEAAHEQGIIHRDLKPANIKLRPDGTVKVLDFGLAKAIEPAISSSPAASMSPTITSPAVTQAGIVLGTAAYMAPEQARGRTVDRRADIWALGVVLYELATGQKLFAGDTTAEVLAEVLKAEIDVGKVPAALRPIVERCLRRDPKLRWQAVGDIRLALAEPIPAALRGVPTTQKASRAGWAAAAFMSLVGLGAVLAYVRQPSVARLEPMRFDVDLGATPAIANLAISPGSHEIAFSGLRDGLNALVLKSLHDGKERILASGPRNIRSVAFSPDGKWLAYTVVTQLMKVSVGGGQPLIIADVGNVRGLSWPGDGYIYYGQTSGPVMRIAENGGAPEPAFQSSPGRRLQVATDAARSLAPSGHLLGCIRSRSDRSGRTRDRRVPVDRARCQSRATHPDHRWHQLSDLRRGDNSLRRSVQFNRFAFGRRPGAALHRVAVPARPGVHGWLGRRELDADLSDRHDWTFVRNSD